MESFQQLTEQGEIAREQGNLDQTLAFFDRALFAAITDKDYSGAVAVLTQRLITFKHAYEKSGDAVYMELFYGDVLTALRLCEFSKMEGQLKAVTYSRSGDYFLFKQDFPEAARHYELALAELNKASDVAEGTKAEYLGHYGEALVKSGDRSGLEKLDEALRMVRSSNHGLRPFHQIVVESGILLRQADAYAFIRQPDKARESLAAAKKLAHELAEKHNMKMRQIQAQNLLEKLGINL